MLKKFDVLYDSAFVVNVAYKTIDKTKKNYVVPGKYAKFLRFLAKVMSHDFMMSVMGKMFKYEKND